VSEIQIGDKVRVTSTPQRGDVLITWEGLVTRTGVEYVHVGSGESEHAFGRKHYAIEVIEKAKPKWREGDLAWFDRSVVGVPGHLRVLRGGAWYDIYGNRQSIAGQIGESGYVKANAWDCSGEVL
jgi:hypothetical protein